MKKIGADESDAAFALTFFLISPVNISLPILFHFLHFLLLNCRKRSIKIDQNVTGLLRR